MAENRTAWFGKSPLRDGRCRSGLGKTDRGGSGEMLEGRADHGENGLSASEAAVTLQAGFTLA